MHYYWKDGTVALEFGKLSRNPTPEALETLRLLEQRMRDPAYKRIGLDKVRGGREVSTVWLPIDHNLCGEGPPIIFETMVFGPTPPRWRRWWQRALHALRLSKTLDLFPETYECERYATEAEARAGHEAMIERCGGRIRR